MQKILSFNNTEFNYNVSCFYDKNKNIWFKGKDVATLLGYKDTDDAIRRHVDKEDKKILPGDSPVRVRWCTFLNESGMYSLILRSKLDSAKKFKKWVTQEVLPSIRKYGYYSV